jgi:hypothetical protein
MILKIHSSQSNEILFEGHITQDKLNEYNIQLTDHNFTEIFEEELLNDLIIENELDHDTIYYELTS